MYDTWNILYAKRFQMIFSKLFFIRFLKLLAEFRLKAWKWSQEKENARGNQLFCADDVARMYFFVIQKTKASIKSGNNSTCSVHLITMATKPGTIQVQIISWVPDRPEGIG